MLKHPCQQSDEPRESGRGSRVSRFVKPAKAGFGTAGPMTRLWKSRAFQVGLSLLLTALLLAFFLRQVRFREIGQAISAASLGWLLLGTTLGLGTFALRALRWTWILRPVARVPYFPAFSATAAGFAANNLPGKVGEVLRPALLAKSRGLPFSPLLASVVLERVFDGASVVFFFLLAVRTGLPRSGGLGRLMIPATLLLALIAVILLAVFRREQTERLLERLWHRLPEPVQPRVKSFATAFTDGFATLRSLRLLLLVGSGSIAMWFVINLQVDAILRAFHLDIPFSASFVVTTFAVLGLMFPTPGGLGSYHVAVQFAVTYFYGVDLQRASAIALLAHASSFVPISLLGLALLAASPLRRQEWLDPTLEKVDAKGETGEDRDMEKGSRG